MTTSEFADIADILAGFGVIASLIFLAYELNKNSRQMKITNWHMTMQGIRETRRRTDDAYVADVVERGRRDFHALTPSEQITFGNFIEEQLLDYDPFIVHGDEIAVGRSHTERAAKLAFREFLASPGARDWWRQSAVRKRWPPHIANEVNEAVRDLEQNDG